MVPQLETRDISLAYTVNARRYRPGLPEWGGEKAVDRNGEDKLSIGDQRSFRQYWKAYYIIVLKMTRVALGMKEKMTVSLRRIHIMHNR